MNVKMVLKIPSGQRGIRSVSPADRVILLVSLVRERRVVIS